MIRAAQAYAARKRYQQIAPVLNEQSRRRFVALEARASPTPSYGEVVAEAKRLWRASPKTGQRLSFREISDRLEDAGHLNERGQAFNAQSVRAMIEGPQPRLPRVKG